MQIDMNVVKNEQNVVIQYLLMLAYMWDQEDIWCPPHENQLIT